VTGREKSRDTLSVKAAAAAAAAAATGRLIA